MVQRKMKNEKNHDILNSLLACDEGVLHSLLFVSIYFISITSRVAEVI